MNSEAKTHKSSSSKNLDDQNDARVLVVSYPSQGHVAPLMKLSHLIADHGVKVTFVSTEFILAQIVDSSPELSEGQCQKIRLVSVPDGLELEDDRRDERKLSESIFKVMPAHLEELIKKANDKLESDDQIACIIADATCTWALKIAEKMGLKRAAFWPSAPGGFALTLHIPKLIEAGIIDIDGTPLKNEKIQLSPNLPAISTPEFMWTCIGDQTKQKIIFKYILAINQTVKISNWLLCNWFHELDPSAENLIPNLLPIGPLLANEQPTGNFWSEDLTCLTWLDKQPATSVIYVAFGSVSIFNQHQFDELALGIELLGRPFLWVVRSNLTTDEIGTKYPDGFNERVADYGKIVQWAPQEKVLSHPSIACFLTHCGWNSTMEGLSMGVPFLCWPCFADQYYNQSCICNAWEVGLWLNPDENGIISRHEVKRKIDELLSNDSIRANALKLKDVARKSVLKGGSSLKNFETFMEQMKH